MEKGSEGGEVSEGTPRSVIRFSFNPLFARLPGNIDIINIRISREEETNARRVERSRSSE